MQSINSAPLYCYFGELLSRAQKNGKKVYLELIDTAGNVVIAKTVVIDRDGKDGIITKNSIYQCCDLTNDVVWGYDLRVYVE